MAGFARSFNQAFSQSLPMGFRANEQSLREELLQGQVDELNFQRETRQLAGEAGAAARAAPIYESTPTTAPNAMGALETSTAAAPNRPGKKAPAWLEVDALRAQAEVLGQRGQHELAARLMAQADAGFERQMKMTSDSMLRAIEMKDYGTAFNLYDEAVPDGMRVENWKLGDDGTVQATLISGDGEKVQWKGGQEELRQLAVGMTDPRAIADMRDKALEREGRLFDFAVNAALRGDQKTAQKVLGGPVKITDTTNAEGVKDQTIELPDGRQFLRSQYEKVSPWAMQEQGNKLEKHDSEMETAGVERQLKGEQVKTQRSLRGYHAALSNQANANAEFIRAGKPGAGGGRGKEPKNPMEDFTSGYAKFRKDLSDVFANDVNLPNGLSPQAATDQLAMILASATATGAQVLPQQIISAMRAGGVMLDRRATTNDGRPVPVWRIKDAATGTTMVIPAVGVAPDTSPMPGPSASGFIQSLPSERGTAIPPAGGLSSIIAP